GYPSTRPQSRVHKIDRDRFFKQRMMRVVVGDDRMGELEPLAVLTFAGAVGADNLDDRCAHLGLLADGGPTSLRPKRSNLSMRALPAGDCFVPGDQVRGSSQ